MVTVGLNIANFGAAGDPAVFGDTILRAEASGFDLAMVSDHVAVTADVDASYPTPFLEAFTLLSWAAGITASIALGTTVTILPYRHPLLVAAMIDTIERVSGRRFVLGAGAGWAQQEYRALGICHAERGQITEDFLAALAAQRNGCDHDGPYASFTGVRSGRFSADVWVGGNSRAAASRAARYAQAWHPLDITLDRLHDLDAPARFGAGGPQPWHRGSSCVLPAGPSPHPTAYSGTERGTRSRPICATSFRSAPAMSCWTPTCPPFAPAPTPGRGSTEAPTPCALPGAPEHRSVEP